MTTRVVDYYGAEYISATITADVELDEQPVTLSFDGGETWVSAVWQGVAGITRTARTAAAVDGSALGGRGVYPMKAKIVSGSEEVVVTCGAVKVI